MVNVINTLKDAPGAISKMSAQMLENKVQFSKTIDMESSSSWRGRDGFDTGDTIQISKPARFEVGTDADITSNLQGVVEEKVPLALDIRKVVAIELTSAEIATDLALASWQKRVLDPAISSIAQHLEKTHLERAYQATYNLVGTAGSTVFDTDTILSAGQKIDENACPDKDNRFVLLNPAAQRSAVNARKGLFQKSDNIATQYLKGVMGTADGFDFLSNNLLPLHTNGNDVSMTVGTTVSTQGQSTIVVAGLTANTGTVTAGTVFTIADVNAVEPITKADQGYVQQFVVTESETADGSGNATLTVSPAMYTTGTLQNISAFPQSGATITVVGLADSQHVQNLAYQKSAFRIASVPLVLPGGTDMASQSTSDGGFTIRVIRDYTVLSDKLIMRLDYLGGFAAVRPEWASRITA